MQNPPASPPISPPFSDAERQYLKSCRLAHLSTLGPDGFPHVVPICYAFDGKVLYSAVDEKPKRVAPARLRRIRNVLQRPQVALVVDSYSEDWSRLGHVLVYGRADVLWEGEEYGRALELLREKYPQYHAMALEGRPVLRINPLRATSWGVL